MIIPQTITVPDCCCTTPEPCNTWTGLTTFQGTVINPTGVFVTSYAPIIGMPFVISQTGPGAWSGGFFGFNCVTIDCAVNLTVWNASGYTFYCGPPPAFPAAAIVAWANSSCGSPGNPANSGAGRGPVPYPLTATLLWDDGSGDTFTVDVIQTHV